MIPSFAPVFLLTYLAILKLNSHLPSRFQIVIIGSLGIASAWLHVLVARAQAAGVGFLSTTREPNELAIYLGYILSLIALGGIWVWLKDQKQGHFIIGLTITLIPILFGFTL